MADIDRRDTAESCRPSNPSPQFSSKIVFNEVAMTMLRSPINCFSLWHVSSIHYYKRWQCKVAAKAMIGRIFNGKGVSNFDCRFENI